MDKEREPLFIGADTVMYDFGVSKAKAYDIIRQLNEELKRGKKIQSDGTLSYR